MQAALREAEVRLGPGETVGKICRGLGISEQTYYKSPREYGGLKMDQAERLKRLERANDRLKKAVSIAHRKCAQLDRLSVPDGMPPPLGSAPWTISKTPRAAPRPKR